MHTHDSTITPNAAALAGAFDVTELEPRRENVWAGVETPGPDVNPGGPDGSGPQPGNI